MHGGSVCVFVRCECVQCVCDMWMRVCMLCVHVNGKLCTCVCGDRLLKSAHVIGASL